MTEYPVLKLRLDYRDESDCPDLDDCDELELSDLDNEPILYCG